MDRIAKKKARYTRVKGSIRAKISGTKERPRLSVFRSNTQIYAQLIDDVAGLTLASASSLDANIKAEKGTKCEMATRVGKLLSERAKEASIDSVVFDRNGYLYHGRVKALAEAAREGGLQF